MAIEVAATFPHVVTIKLDKEREWPRVFHCPWMWVMQCVTLMNPMPPEGVRQTRATLVTLLVPLVLSLEWV
jgi:hypothetical protein